MTRQMFALSLGLGAMLAAARIAQPAPQCDNRETLTLPDGRMGLIASCSTYKAVIEDLPAKGAPT